MSRVTVLALAAAALALPAAAAVAGDAHTTRIEPRPFYGATVTLEEGVRVFRALPAQRHVIIAPENKTSLSLNYTEEHHFSRNYNSNAAGSSEAGSGGNGGGLHGGYSNLGAPGATATAGHGGNGVFPGRRVGAGPKVINAKP